jgi:uncharacterized membrane protein YqjE
VASNYRNITPEIGTVVSEHARTIGDIISELKTELQEFVATRLEMLRSEMGEKLRTLKMAAPAMLVGLLLLITAWFVFTGFLVCMIAQAFAPRPWAYALSFLVVAALYAVIGGTAAYVGWRQLRTTGMRPERTIHVLKQDRVWLQREVKSL